MNSSYYTIMNVYIRTIGNDYSSVSESGSKPGKVFIIRYLISCHLKSNQVVRTSIFVTKILLPTLL